MCVVLYTACIVPCSFRCNEDGSYTFVWQNSRIESCLNPRWAQTVS